MSEFQRPYGIVYRVHVLSRVGSQLLQFPVVAAVLVSSECAMSESSRKGKLSIHCGIKLFAGSEQIFVAVVQPLINVCIQIVGVPWLQHMYSIYA